MLDRWVLCLQQMLANNVRQRLDGALVLENALQKLLVPCKNMLKLLKQLKIF